LEQLTPFPFDLVKAEMERFPSAHVQWVQEEHKNMGFWTYCQPRINTVLKHINSNKHLSYAGRHSSAATATGCKGTHIQEHSKVMKNAMKVDTPTTQYKEY